MQFGGMGPMFSPLRLHMLNVCSGIRPALQQRLVPQPALWQLETFHVQHPQIPLVVLAAAPDAFQKIYFPDFLPLPKRALT